MTRYPRTILVSCQIPWDDREQLLEDRFREEIRHFARLGFRDMYIFGTAGEGYAVDLPRFRRIVEIFAEETAALRPMVGVIGLSTITVIERLRIAYDLGCRTFQISLPSWGALNDAEMPRFFEHVCGAFPDCSFLHYNLPRTKRVLAPADYRRLVAAIPNLVATKNTGTTIKTTMELLQQAPELQHFLSESMFPSGCLHGECSLLSSSGPMVARRAQELFRLATTGRTAEAFLLHRDYMRVLEEILAPMRRREMMDGAYDKMIVRLGGFDMPLRLLSPYDSFDETIYEECLAIYNRHREWIMA